MRAHVIIIAIRLLFKEKNRPFLLKYIERKLDIITEDQFKEWVYSDALL